MTEKEKSLNGKIYNPRDLELMTLAQTSRILQDKYNLSYSLSNEERKKILEKLLNKIGKNSWIEKPFFCDYGKNISIGNNTFINFNCTFLDCNEIIIGDNVLIGPGTGIFTPSHPINPKERVFINESGEIIYGTFANKIIIENNVWIGGNVSILPGIVIGENSIIGAGSVITKNIPKNVIAVGNPCKVIKNLDK